jgi:GNAT superfamily N-acetyltransferase
MHGVYNRTMYDVVIIPASDVDWQQYRALRLEALQTDPQAFGSSYAEQVAQPPEYWQGRLADAIAGRNNWLLFARRGTELVGMVGAFQSEAMGSQNIAMLIAMYVTASARKQGVSRQLVTSLLDLLRTTPVRRVRLTVNVRQTAALRLYERLGFQTICSENGMMGDGKYYREYIMGRQLD